jgi:hypothetical protein
MIGNDFMMFAIQLCRHPDVGPLWRVIAYPKPRNGRAAAGSLKNLESRISNQPPKAAIALKGNPIPYP